MKTEKCKYIKIENAPYPRVRCVGECSMRRV